MVCPKIVAMKANPKAQPSLCRVMDERFLLHESKYAKKASTTSITNYRIGISDKSLRTCWLMKNKQ